MVTIKGKECIVNCVMYYETIISTNPALFICICFDIDFGSQSRILHGTGVREGEIPYQVLIESKSCGYTDRFGMCGGVLVEDANKKQWIVTAGHCMSLWGPRLPKSLDAVKIKAGGVDRRYRRNWQTRNIPLDSHHIVIHPKWKGTGPKPYSECSAGEKRCPYCKHKNNIGQFKHTLAICLR